MAITGAPENGNGNHTSRLIIEGEPDLATGTLEDWTQYRQKLAELPQDDDNVRIAISVAEARIHKLIRDAQSRPR